MSTPQFPAYGIVQSEQSFLSKTKLSDEARRAADALERAIASDPALYQRDAIPVGRNDALYIYEDPHSGLVVSFEVDRKKERVYFFLYKARQFPIRRIFISYSRADQLWLEEIKKFFGVLESAWNVLFWHDAQIPPGDDWKETLEQEICAARAAVLLVSDSFLDSPFISQFELPKILAEKRKRNENSVFWIHLDRSDVEERAPEIACFQSLSTDPRIPLADLARLKGNSLRDELLEIVNRLARALNGKPKDGDIVH